MARYICVAFAPNRGLLGDAAEAVIAKTPMAIMSKPIRVLCVDDSCDVTSMLARLMSFETDVTCVGELSSADRLVEEVGALSPDVVLIDLTMPGRDPLSAVRELKLSGSACRVLVYSGHDDDQTKASAMAAGACGVVGKDQPYEIVIGAIRAACEPGGRVG